MSRLSPKATHFITILCFADRGSRVKPTTCRVSLLSGAYRTEPTLCGNEAHPVNRNAISWALAAGGIVGDAAGSGVGRSLDCGDSSPLFRGLAAPLSVKEIVLARRKPRNSWQVPGSLLSLNDARPRDA